MRKEMKRGREGTENLFDNQLKLTSVYVLMMLIFEKWIIVVFLKGMGTLARLLKQ